MCNKKGVKICGFIGSILITCYLAYFTYFAFTVYNEIQSQSPIIYEEKGRTAKLTLRAENRLICPCVETNRFQNTRILTEIPSQIPTLRQPIFIAKNPISS